MIYILVVYAASVYSVEVRIVLFKKENQSISHPCAEVDLIWFRCDVNCSKDSPSVQQHTYVENKLRMQSKNGNNSPLLRLNSQL